MTDLLAALCVVGWRAFWSTVTARAAAAAAPAVAFTPAEVAGRDRIAVGPPATRKRTVSHSLREVAKLGGYLARAKNPPPGYAVVWRGLVRLADVLTGVVLRSEVVGN